MNEQVRLLFLGTGGSMGIPVIGCTCAVCQSNDSKDRRLRPSVLLHIGSKKILVDSGPDYRTQALLYKIHHLDGVIITHAHHDHTAGIDDLRAYHLFDKHPLPCLMSDATAQDLFVRYDYIFNGFKKQTLVPKLSVEQFSAKRGRHVFLGIPFDYFTYTQGGMEVNGFKVGSLGFVSDVKEYPPSIFEDLKGIKTLVISALRFETSPLHLSVNEAVEFSKKTGAEKTYLTHISHDLSHHEVSLKLPPGISMAYDGLLIKDWL